MTRTPPDETRGDLKARVQRKQNALRTSFFRGVWPAVPMVFSALWCTYTNAHHKTGQGDREFFRGDVCNEGQATDMERSTRDMLTWNVNANACWVNFSTQLHDDYSYMSGGLEPRAPLRWPRGFVFRQHSVIAELSSLIELWNARTVLFKPPCACANASRGFFKNATHKEINMHE